MTFIPANSNRDFWAAFAAVVATLAALFGGTALARRIAHRHEAEPLENGAGPGEPGAGGTTSGESR